MAISLITGKHDYIIGTGAFLHAFFSTIAYRLEDNKWGSKYPNLMLGLYNGELQPNECAWVLDELTIIMEQLSQLPPNKVVWDIDNLDAQPPWKDNIANTITNLSNYFITSDGKQLLEVLNEALNQSVLDNTPLQIQ